MNIGERYSDNKIYKGIKYYDQMPLMSEDLLEYEDLTNRKTDLVLTNLFENGLLNTPGLVTNLDGIFLSGPVNLLINGDVSIIQTDDSRPIISMTDIEEAAQSLGSVCILGWYQHLTMNSVMRNYGGVDNSVIPNDLYNEGLELQPSTRYQFRWMPIILPQSDVDPSTSLTKSSYFTCRIIDRDVTGAKLSSTSILSATNRIGSSYLTDVPSSWDYVAEDHMYLIPLIRYTYEESTLSNAAFYDKIQVAGESGKVMTYAEFMELTPDQQNRGDYYIPDYPDGIPAGHTIIDEGGSSYPQRNNLKFIGATITDDESNDTTIVKGFDSKIVAPTEVSPSTHDYNIGNQLFYNNKLYTVNVGIAIGDELLIDSFFEPKTWNGYASPSGSSIWTDGENIYFSGGTVSKQYVLDKATSTWNPKTWNGLSSPAGGLIWTDGEDIYFSGYVNSRLNAQYILDKSTSTWNEKIWNGFNELKGYNIWTDGNNIYYSDPESGPNEYQFVLDKSTSTWNEINWNYPRIYGSQIWSDGEHIYCSYNASQFVFNKNDLTWSNLPSSLIIERGEAVWNDGVNTYYSWGAQQLVLDKSTSTWKTKEWSGLNIFSASAIWSDGENTYCSEDSNQYILRKSNIVPSDPIVEQIDNIETNQQSIQHQLTDQTNVLGAKNLIPYPYLNTTKTQAGITFTDNGNGLITANAASATTGAVSFVLWRGGEDALPKGEYILSDSGESSDNVYVAINKEDSTGAYIADLVRLKANTHEVKFNIDYNGYSHVGIQIYARAGATASNLVFHPMLRLASDPDNTYVPFAMTNRELTEDVGTLKNNLKATYNSAEIPFKFGIDANGNYGYIKAGADSVTPFKNPSGTINITSNGTHNVVNYASANVSIPNNLTNETSKGVTLGKQRTTNVTDLTVGRYCLIILYYTATRNVDYSISGFERLNAGTNSTVNQDGKIEFVYCAFGKITSTTMGFTASAVSSLVGGTGNIYTYKMS